MSYEKDLSYVYQEVFSKKTFNPKLNAYIIRKEDYLSLNLSTKQLQILKQMCKNQGIILEESPYRLPAIEDIELFKEYNRINQTIISSGISKEKHPLNKKRIDIRNQIVLANLPLVRTIIDKNYEEFQNIPNKDEIYQLGYLLLIIYIEHGKIVEPKIFTNHISSKLMFDIKDKLLRADNSISSASNELLKKISDIESNISRYPTQKELSDELNIESKKAQRLINIDRFISSISIDEEIKLLGHTKESKIEQSPLYDNTFEEQIVKSTARDIIIKMLNTLAENQKQILMLSYGFQDGRCYNDVEIANMLGLTKARIGIIRHAALDNLRLKIRSQYMIDYSEDSKVEELSEANEKQLKNLEEILIGLIPKEELINYLTNIPKLEQDIFSLYHGLRNEKKHSLQEICEILNISHSSVVKYKSKSYENLKIEIAKNHNKKFNNYQEYIEYLIENYVIKPKHKRKKWTHGTN